MNKQSITFKADEQELIKTGGISSYASNIVAYIEATFELGTNWNGYDSVRAVWSNDYLTDISTVLDSNGKCIVPTEVLTDTGNVTVNLVGSIADGDTLTDRLTTYPCKAVIVDADAKVEGDETESITPSQFEQFVEIVHDEAEQAEADADRAEEAADKAEQEADKAEQAAANAGYMFFHINEAGHLIYERTPNTQVDFYLNNGHLFVEAIA